MMHGQKNIKFRSMNARGVAQR